ncbi:MAG: DegQ family serine endoprotease [Gammaproteobacteria bacterium]|nr:DegQ family serine endoprotease [Gammaproteobacteria bacterium]
MAAMPFAALTFTALIFAAAPAHAVAPLAEVPTLAPMIAEVSPAVVNIATSGTENVRSNPLFDDPFFKRFFERRGREFPQRKRQVHGQGSGVVIDAAEGHVITNHHVVEDADEIIVTLGDGREFEAELIGSDPEVDIALLQIPAEDLSTVTVGDSSRLRVGDFVVAIGNPFGLSQTVTSGIVSGLGRNDLGIESYEDFIQTDAAINRGNSGGALVNLRGELIGINTAILAPGGGSVGIGFAIPSNLALSLTGQILEHGKVRRGRLGVYIQDLDARLAEAFGLDNRSGALISRVEPDSPAEEAGLQSGDVVLSVDHRKVDSASDLRNIIGLMRVGQEARINFWRKGRMMSVDILLRERRMRQVAGAEFHHRLRGALLKELKPDEDDGDEGVQVAEVEEGSPAADAGLRGGDIIVSVNRHAVASLQQMREAVGLERGRLLLLIKRDESAFYLALR